MEWISIEDKKPDQEGDILFTSNPGKCFFSGRSIRIGLAIPSHSVVLLDRTDLSFDDIVYWLPIPKLPEKS